MEIIISNPLLFKETLITFKEQGESMHFGARPLRFGFNRMISNDFVNIPFKPINCKKLAE